MVAHRENLHYMDHEEADSNRDQDIEPPAGPEEVEEAWPSKAFLFVYEAYTDVNKSCGTHRVATNIQALDGMANHYAPYVGEYGIACSGEYVEGDEQSKVEEKENISEDFHCD